MKISLAENISESEEYNYIEGVRIGKIVEIDEKGRVFVDFNGNIKGPVAAKVTKSIKCMLEKQDDLSLPDVLMVFEDNDSKLPVVIDTLFSTIETARTDTEVSLEIDKPENVTVDGKTITFDAKEQIVLRCGKSSITLTRSGKVIIRGAYLLNRSSGVNKIKGGSVQIN